MKEASVIATDSYFLASALRAWQETGRVCVKQISEVPAVSIALLPPSMVQTVTEVSCVIHVPGSVVETSSLVSHRACPQTVLASTGNATIVPARMANVNCILVPWVTPGVSVNVRHLPVASTGTSATLTLTVT